VTSGQKVVIIDGVPETAEVLQAVFEPRGHRVERIRSHATVCEKRTSNSVLVLHDDAEGTRRSQYGSAPRVVIGSITSEAADPSETHLSSMFQFAELVRAVEDLLTQQASAERRAA
jgi:hypothetical protein